MCGGVHGIGIYLCGVAPLRKALRAQNRLKIEKKCAGECTVLKFICMFAVLNLFSTRAVKAVRMHRMRAFFVPESEAAYIAVRQPRGMVVMAVPALVE